MQLIIKKGIAECIGTFVLVLFGTGTAVLGGGAEGVGILGVSMAFGLSIVAMAYSIGTISGCHINPAVSLAMFINKRITEVELAVYVCAQLIGAILGSTVLRIFLQISGKFSAESMGQNSFGDFGMGGAFLAEFILSFVFILVIVTVTGKNGKPKLAGLVIGFTLVLIHLLGIPITGTSVNPARSIGPAIFSTPQALSELWLFVVAPICGGILAAIVGKTVLDTEVEVGKAPVSEVVVVEEVIEEVVVEEAVASDAPVEEDTVSKE